MTGNSLGNIVNGGIVTQKEDWIYYQNKDFQDRIFKIKTDGSNREKVNDDGSNSSNDMILLLFY